ncbi:MAG TPA: RNase adapter RapZ [Gammaproteobacteria bacterium]|nr:RNase adapter RapZ [Gammaproteobacteria bacterium]
MRLIILSGLSGSGKSVALHMLEDLDYYCVDNIPAGLLQEFVRVTLLSSDPAYNDMAIGIDARNRLEDIQTVPETVRQLRAQGIECEIVFLHAEEGVLLKRYNETHRPHPLADEGRSLRDAIRTERELLGAIADEADVVLDTTRTSIHELRELVRARIHRGERRGLSLLFQSFGFRHGLPGDSDFIFDARGLPNPYWEPKLRALTGKDPAVVRFLDDSPVGQRFVQDLRTLLAHWIPQFESSNRQYLTVSVGCTGGYHRSVYVVEKLAAHFRELGREVLVKHNELK